MPGRHRTSGKTIPFEFTGPETVRAVTLMIDLLDDGTYTALIGVQNMTNRRYQFVNLPRGKYTTGHVTAITTALIAAAYDVAVDDEVRQLVK